MAGDPSWQDLLTDLDEDGERVSFALQPQTHPGGPLPAARGGQAVGPGLLRQAHRRQVRGQGRPERRDRGLPARGQEVRHQLRRQRRGVPPAPAEERPGLRHGSHRHQGRPQPAAVGAGAAQGLLRAHRGGAARRHHRERRQDAHQPGPGLQRGAHRPLPRHAAGRRRLRGGLRHQPERPRHHHDLRPAGDPRGRVACSTTRSPAPSTSTTPPSSSTTSSSRTTASSSRGSGSSPAKWPTCSPTSTA